MGAGLLIWIILPARKNTAEYAPEPNPTTGKKDVVWFALNDDRPLFAFGGIWTEFRGDRGRKSKPIPGPHLVYGFLTTAPNAVVEPGWHFRSLRFLLETKVEGIIPKIDLIFLLRRGRRN
jgi:putative SOS response-associated peptidase YedK